MTAPAAPPTAKPAPRRRAGPFLAALAGLLVLLAVGLYDFYYPAQAGQVQPIPFSHRLHAGQKKIGCLFCHADAIDTPQAGLPPLETCMLCHSRIIVDNPYIVTLRQQYESGTPVEWAPVNLLPDYAHFNHVLHVRSGFDCGRCHGSVSGMDRMTVPHKFLMGFCVECHKAEGYSHDCLVCHR